MTPDWLRMWVKPRETIRSIVIENPKRGFVWLSGLYGVLLLLRFFQEMSLGESLSVGWIVVAALVLAAPVGMLMLSLFSLLLYWVGKLIRGKANYYEVRAAVSWSNVTMIGSLVMWIVMIASFERRLFFLEFYNQTFVGQEAIAVMANFLLLTVFGIWGLIIFLHALGEVQGFSFWMALLNAILVGILLILISMGLGYLLTLGGGS